MWYIGNCTQLTVQYSLVIYNLLVRYKNVADFGSVVSSLSFPLSCVFNLNSILLLAPFVFHLKNIFTICSAFHSFIHSICTCKMRYFLAVLRSFFHTSLLCTFSCHPTLPAILPSSVTSSCHLFLGLLLNLVVPKFIYNTLLGILFSSILCTCPN